MIILYFIGLNARCWNYNFVFNKQSILLNVTILILLYNLLLFIIHYIEYKSLGILYKKDNKTK